MGSIRSLKVLSWWKAQSSVEKVAWLAFVFILAIVLGAVLSILFSYFHSDVLSFIGFLLCIMVFIGIFVFLDKKFPIPYWKTEAFRKLSDEERSVYWRTPEGLAKIKKDQRTQERFDFWSTFVIIIFLIACFLLGLFGLVKLIKYFWYI